MRRWGKVQTAADFKPPAHWSIDITSAAVCGIDEALRSLQSDPDHCLHGLKKSSAGSIGVFFLEILIIGIENLPLSNISSDGI